MFSFLTSCVENSDVSDHWQWQWLPLVLCFSGSPTHPTFKSVGYLGWRAPQKATNIVLGGHSTFVQQLQVLLVIKVREFKIAKEVKGSDGSGSKAV